MQTSHSLNSLLPCKPTCLSTNILKCFYSIRTFQSIGPIIFLSIRSLVFHLFPCLFSLDDMLHHDNHAITGVGKHHPFPCPLSPPIIPTWKKNPTLDTKQPLTFLCLHPEQLNMARETQGNNQEEQFHFQFMFVRGKENLSYPAILLPSVVNLIFGPLWLFFHIFTCLPKFPTPSQSQMLTLPQTWQCLLIITSPDLQLGHVHIWATNSSVSIKDVP